MIAAARESIEAIGIETSPKVILADAGYCSEDNLARLEKDDINALDRVTGRLKARREGASIPTRQDPRGGHETRTHGTAPSNEVRKGRLRETKGHRRTGLWTDEGTTARWPAPTTRPARRRR